METTVMDRSVIKEITARFQALVSMAPLRTIHTEKEYDQAVSTPDQLLDAGAADERSPLADLANSFGSFSGKRELNVRQIKALSDRFHVPTSIFI